MMQKLGFVWLLCSILAGCGAPKPPEAVDEPQLRASRIEPQFRASRISPERVTDTLVEDSIAPQIYDSVPPSPDSFKEPNAFLLSATLSPEQLKQGWIRLFNGYEMAGWFYMGSANWRFGEGIITVDGGEPSLLCTNFQVSDFELLVDFNCSAKTDSGVFLRTSADPRDMARDCYELNIAPPNNEYPTGSLVKRQKADADQVGSVTPNEWHTYRIIVQGDQVRVWLDGKAIIEYTDPRKLHRGYIGLHYALGVARFRNILMRPLGGEPLAVNEGWQADWKPLPNLGASFQVEANDTGLHLRGGPGQLQSTGQWDDFILQATYQVANPNVDSGILFRALPDRFNEAYECQIYHGLNTIGSEKSKLRMQTGSLSIPIKGETNNARVLTSDGTRPTHMTIIADEGQFSAFVDGVLVAEVADTRELSPNPRVGFRREAGKLGLQAADETCDITFSSMTITPMPSRQ